MKFRQSILIVAALFVTTAFVLLMSPTAAHPQTAVGDDVQGEYVRIENKGGVTAVMTGWTLSDDDSHVYNFPSGFSLSPGAAVQVWVKSEANNATNLYWGSAQAFWNNTGDVAYLRNGATLVDSCSYSGGGTQASC